MTDVLFLWDADSNDSRRRYFYNKLSGFSRGEDYYYPGVLEKMPEDSWCWINKSTLLVEEEEAERIKDLIDEFDEVLDWYEFKVEETRSG